MADYGRIMGDAAYAVEASDEVRAVPCRHPREFGGSEHEYDLRGSNDATPDPLVRNEARRCDGCEIDDPGHLNEDAQDELRRHREELARATRIFDEDDARTQPFPNEFFDEPGLKDDAGKPRLDLLPWRELMSVAEVMTFGASKYGERNYLGLSTSRLLGAALRHIAKFAVRWDPDDLDPETNEPHLSHAVACLLMIAHKLRAGTGRDDRPAS